MKTPILDFVTEYEKKKTLRLHMPGHKGTLAGDITEIAGADSLYEAEGIIAESEQNASALFGHPTVYSTEGSSQCIRAMVRLAAAAARRAGKEPLILAGRNAHKSFLSAVALLDVAVEWLFGEGGYLSCAITPATLERALQRVSATAVYLTNPDYLGNLLDIESLARVCRRYGAYLLVDNAHGAYLRFLKPSLHPMDLGADLVCDSAHKTLPVLTGGAYLHYKGEFAPYVKEAMALFGSTSPSYLILSSLDQANAYLVAGYAEKLAAFLPKKEALCDRLHALGYTLYGSEPLKITLAPKSCGYTGVELAEILRQKNIEVEFADPDFLVCMLSPEFGEWELERLGHALAEIEAKTPISDTPPLPEQAERVLSPRQAMLAPYVFLPVTECKGRVLAAATVGCPPAVPILMAGERIDDAAVQAFLYYGITRLAVVE